MLVPRRNVPSNIASAYLPPHRPLGQLGVGLERGWHRAAPCTLPHTSPCPDAVWLGDAGACGSRAGRYQSRITESQNSRGWKGPLGVI